MKLTVKKDGLEDLKSKLLTMADAERGLKAAERAANIVTGNAKGNVYTNGLTYVDGMIRDSLFPVSGMEDGHISFGVGTNNMVAIYHEMGTGPVGTSAGYPGEPFLDVPIGTRHGPANGEVSRRDTGWTYWSDEVVATRSAETAEDGEEQEPNGYVYTEGVPPKAFMFNALNANAEKQTEAVIKAILGGSDNG